MPARRKSDLESFIAARKKRDPEFAEGFEEGYEALEIGVLLRRARQAAGVSQEELARRMGTRKPVISRLENHAEDVRLSTLRRVARALGKRLELQLVERD